MRKFLSIVICCCAIAFSAVAQQPADSTSAGVSGRLSLSAHLRASGRVTLQQDSRLESLVSSVPKSYYSGGHKAAGQEVYYMAGYRVRVFSGNNQVQSKALAYQIESELRAKKPDLQTYVVFKTPNWRLLVGNYRTSEEAIAALRTLKKEFPSRGREMFVIKDEIELPIE